MRGFKKFKQIIGAVLLGASVGLLVFSGFVYLYEGERLPILKQVQDDVLALQDDPAKSYAFGRAGIRAYVVMSGSMEPNIKTGSLVITKSSPSYSIGDVITFETKGGNLVTHRIVDISPIGDSGGVEYITKGDANEERDYSPVPSSSVVGVATHSIPYVGYAASFAKTPRGFVALVIVPSSIIIWEEIKVLFGESKKGARRLSSKLPMLKQVQHDGHSRFKKLAFVIPGVASLLLVVAVSSAALTDIETSVGNVLAVYTPTPSPTGGPTPTPSETPTPTPTPAPGRVVINEVYYDPDDEHKQGGSSENNFEWVELYNGTSSVVNLKDWKITDATLVEKSISTSNRDLNPGEFVVISRAANTRVLWGIPEDKFIPIGEPIGGGLNNDGDRVILEDDGGNLIDQMGYQDDIGIWNPAAPDVAKGHSLERNPTGFDSDLPSDFIDKSLPTPGL